MWPRREPDRDGRNRTRARPAWLLATSLAAGASLAQSPDITHDGRWSVTIETSGGARESTRLVLREFGGSWQATSGRRAVAGSACAGRSLPVTVQESTAETLDFTVWAKQISPRCRNLTVSTKASGPNAFVGTVESVGTIRLARR